MSEESGTAIKTVAMEIKIPDPVMMALWSKDEHIRRLESQVKKLEGDIEEYKTEKRKDRALLEKAKEELKSTRIEIQRLRSENEEQKIAIEKLKAENKKRDERDFVFKLQTSLIDIHLICRQHGLSKDEEKDQEFSDSIRFMKRSRNSEAHNILLDDHPDVVQYKTRKFYKKLDSYDGDQIEYIDTWKTLIKKLITDVPESELHVSARDRKYGDRYWD